MILIVVIAALLSTFVGWATASIANWKGRDPATWFLLGFFLGPVPLIVACVMEKREFMCAGAR